jgi:hypothetical protein
LDRYSLNDSTVTAFLFVRQPLGQPAGKLAVLVQSAFPVFFTPMTFSVFAVCHDLASF